MLSTKPPEFYAFYSQEFHYQVVLHVFGNPKKIKQPGIVYFHGGLFNSGHIRDCYSIAKRLAETTKVVCVEYPLSPEWHFPRTGRLAYEAIKWIHANARKLGIYPGQLTVAGDLAGGNLAAAVSMMARDSKEDFIRNQVLINPMLDPYQASGSMREVADCKYRKPWRDYLPDSKDYLHPYAAPVHSMRLTNLPPAIIITGELDPLRDEGELYAANLIAAGVPVNMRRILAGSGDLVSRDNPSFDQVCAIIELSSMDATARC